MIRQHSDRVEYAGWDQGYRGVLGTVWVGDPVTYGQATTIGTDVPTEEMNARFSITFHEDSLSDSAGVFTLTVEWFYFSPDPELLAMPFSEALIAVRDEVDLFRVYPGGAPRVNTAGLTLAVEASSAETPPL